MCLITLNYKMDLIKKERILLLIIIINILINGFWRYSTDAQNSASTGVTVNYIKENLYNNETSSIKQFVKNKDKFYRLSGRNLTKNANILSNISSTQFYWSISNPYINKYRKKMELNENIVYMYNGYDDRTILNSLASVRYYSIPANDSTTSIPYGYKYIDTIEVNEKIIEEENEKLKNELNVKELSKKQKDIITNLITKKYKIYENENYLPLTYSYDNYINIDKWDKLSAIEKQEKLLNSAVLEKSSNFVNEKEINSSIEKLYYNFSSNKEEVNILENKFVITKANSKVTLTFNGKSNSETYISIKGLDFKNVSKYDLYNKDLEIDPENLYNNTVWNRFKFSDKITLFRDKIYGIDVKNMLTLTFNSEKSRKSLQYFTKEHNLYSGRHDFCINMGYSEEPQNTIIINFPEIGVYSFENIDISVQPMNDIKEKINSLKKDTLNDTKITNDKVTGKIKIKNPKILVFSIPYSKGWKAKVNGIETELLNVNISYMGLDLDKGEYNIELIYETPYKKVGLIISIITLVGVITFVFVCEKKIKKQGG